jgi:hypothetical protein
MGYEFGKWKNPYWENLDMNLQTNLSDQQSRRPFAFTLNQCVSAFLEISRKTPANPWRKIHCLFRMFPKINISFPGQKKITKQSHSKTPLNTLLAKVYNEKTS